MPLKQTCMQQSLDIPSPILPSDECMTARHFLTVDLTELEMCNIYNFRLTNHTLSLPLNYPGPTDPGVEQLKAALIAMVPTDIRTASSNKPFLFAVDHCFPIKGQGTVMTGTVLQVGAT